MARDQHNFDILLSTRDGNYLVGVLASNGARADTQRWAELLLKALPTGYSSSHSDSITIDDHTWEVLDGTTPWQGQTLTFHLYVYAGDGAAFSLTTLSPQSAPSAQVSQLRQIVESFRFPLENQ